MIGQHPQAIQFENSSQHLQQQLQPIHQQFMHHNVPHVSQYFGVAPVGPTFDGQNATPHFVPNTPQVQRGVQQPDQSTIQSQSNIPMYQQR